jgi:hypothetical protein
MIVGLEVRYRDDDSIKLDNFFLNIAVNNKEYSFEDEFQR